MESGTKKILAVVIVVVVVVAIAVPAVIFLAPAYGAVQIGTLVTPGAPADTPANRIIKLGILSSMTEIQGEGCWTGAYMRADEINSAGGVDVGGETYYFGIVSEDTYETEPIYDLSKGISAATKMLADHDPDFLLGGFRTEMVTAYREVVMDAKKIFIGLGAASDFLCQSVLDEYGAYGVDPRVTQPGFTGGNYTRYKYWFRSNPINGTSLVGQLLGFLAYLKGYMSTVLAKNITNVGVIREDLAWTTVFGIIFPLYLPLYGFSVKKDIAYPLTATAEDFAGYLQEFEDEDVQIIIPVISAQGGIILSSQYALTQPKAIMAGIDVMAQLDTYWGETGGGCEHLIHMRGVTRVPKTPTTIEFWDNYQSLYGHDPLYTTQGGYDTVSLYYNAIRVADSLDTDDVITALESFKPGFTPPAGIPRHGISAYTGILSTHDVMAGYHAGTDTLYGVTLFVQWQSPGNAVSVPCPPVYPDALGLAQANITLPSWGINDQ